MSYPPASGSHQYAPVQPAEDPGKVLSIVGIVLAFFVPLAGLICSVLGRNKSRETGFDGQLGKIGLILNIVFMVLGVISLIFYFAVFAAAVSNGVSTQY